MGLDLIVSYGIGSVIESPISQYQLAFLLEASEAFSVQAQVFDPVLGESEHSLLQDIFSISRAKFPFVTCHFYNFRVFYR